MKLQQQKTISNRIRGAAMTELLVTMLGLVPLVMGTVQTALIYNAKEVLNYATYEAARAGSVGHAKKSPMKQALARGLVPLYGGGKDNTSLATSYGKALVDVYAPVVPFTKYGSSTGIAILSPTKEAFQDHGVTYKNQQQIPNEHLKYKARTVGSNSGVNLQDANLLKIKVTYGYKLFVPVINKIIGKVMLFADPDNAQYYLADPPRLPIVAMATVRMQSNAYLDDNESYPGGGGGTVPGGGGTVPGGGDPGQGGDDNNGGGDTGYDDTAPPADDPIACDTSGTCDAGDPAACGGGAGNQSTNTAAVGVGNPINVVTGNKYQQEVDIASLPGKLGLEFVRHYNSQSPYKGSLGYRWRHTYDVRLNRKNPDAIYIDQADGRRVVFETRDTDDEQRVLANVASDGWLELHEETTTWHWHNGRKLQFDRDGRLNYVVAQTGQTIYLTYDSEGRLLQVNDPQDRTLVFAYYPNDRIKAIVDPTGNRTEYSYDFVGNLSSVIRSNNTLRYYHYEDIRHKHSLTGITNERGIRYATWAYDAKGRGILSTHANNVGKVTLSYLEGKTKVTNSKGVTSIYFTELKNAIPTVVRVDGAGCSTCGTGNVQYKYNDRIQLTDRIRKDGSRTRYNYDSKGRLVEVSERFIANSTNHSRNRLVARYEYEGEQQLKPNRIIRPSINPNAEHRFEIKYNQNQQPIQVTEKGYQPTSVNRYRPISRTTKLKYTNGNLTTIDGPRKDVQDLLQFSYDAMRRLKSLTSLDGSILKVQSYDTYGRPSQIQNNNQSPINVEYTQRGDIGKITYNNQTVIYNYTATGQVKSVITSDGKTTTTEYDNADRPIKYAQGSKYEGYVGLDTENRTIQSHVLNKVDGTVSLVNYLYDAQGRLVKEKNAQGEVRRKYGYDVQGRITNLMDKQGRDLAIKYNATGQLLSLVESENGVTRMQYDVKPGHTSVKNERGHLTDYYKDDFGRIVIIDSPDSGKTKYRYDEADNKVEQNTEHGSKITLAYDAANRLTRHSTDDNDTLISYKNGKIDRIKDANSIETFAYDNQQRLIAHHREIGGKIFSVHYNFDEDTGRLMEKVLPDGQTLRMHYTKAGKLRGVSRKGMLWQQKVLWGEMQYTANGNLRSYTQGNGLQTRFNYKNNMLMGIETDHVQKLVYAFNEQGEITGIVRNNKPERFAYDTAGRLIEAHTTEGHYQYVYDRTGNPLLKVKDGKVDRLTYAKENNRLLEISSVDQKNTKPNIKISYDKAGRPVQKGNKRFVYNLSGRVSELYESEVKKASYIYNSRGQRIQKKIYDTQGKVVKSYTYLYEGANLLGEINQKGEGIYYLYLGYRPVVMLTKDKTFSIHSDHTGTPRVITDESGNKVWSAEYSPFGKTKINTQLITFNLRMPGQYADAESNTYYNYQRDYDPVTGRYNTPDPLGLKGGRNLYAYVDNSPLNYVDPLGLAKLQYLLISGGLNSSAQGSGILHWAFVLTPDVGDAFTTRMVYDPNGTFNAGDGGVTTWLPDDESFGRNGKDELISHYGQGNILKQFDPIHINGSTYTSDAFMLLSVLNNSDGAADGAANIYFVCNAGVPTPKTVRDLLPTISQPFMPNHTGGSVYPGSTMRVTPKFFYKDGPTEGVAPTGETVSFSDKKGADGQTGLIDKQVPDEITGAGNASSENCSAIFEHYKDRAELILMNAGTNGRERNKAINSAYAELATSHNNLKWMGLGAVASFNVGCALDRIESKRDDFFPNLALEPEDFDLLRDALYQGNQTLFLDIYTWHLMQIDNSEAIKSCSAGSGFPINSYVKEGLAATAQSGDQQWDSLRKLAVHEQVNILGPSIYKNTRLREMLRDNELYPELFGAEHAEAILDSDCNGGHRNSFGKSVQVDGYDVYPRYLFDDDIRMRWIAGVDHTGKNDFIAPYAGNIADQWIGIWKPSDETRITESYRNQVLNDIREDNVNGSSAAAKLSKALHQ